MMRSFSTSLALSAILFLLLLCNPSIASPLSWHSSSQGYLDPRLNGGSMLTDAFNGLGEPLNVIVSGHSDPQVLTQQGFLNYALSLRFGDECRGLHFGGRQTADLGDGLSSRAQTGLLRENFGDQAYGTCRQSVQGGNHFRYWQQNGAAANSSAVFIAASIERNFSHGHDIVPNGYDLGRDDLVSRADRTGGTYNAGMLYHTSVHMVSGLLSRGSGGINHDIRIDGLVAVLTVSVSEAKGGQRLHLQLQSDLI